MGVLREVNLFDVEFLRLVENISQNPFNNLQLHFWLSKGGSMERYDIPALQLSIMIEREARHGPMK